LTAEKDKPPSSSARATPPGSEASKKAAGMLASVPSNLYLIRKMLVFGWEFRGGFALSLCFQTLLLLISMTALGLQGLGVDFLRYHLSNHDIKLRPHWPLNLAPPDDWSAMNVIWLIAGAILVLAAGTGFLRYHAAAIHTKLVEKLIIEMRSRVYDKLQRLSFRFYEANETGSMINRVGGDVQGVRGFLDLVLVQVVILVLSLTLYLGYMWQMSPRLTIACLATTPILFIASSVFIYIIRPMYENNRKLSDKLILTLSESVQGIHVVKGFAREKQETSKFNTASDNISAQQKSIFLSHAIYGPSVAFLTQINLMVLLLYGGYLVIDGQLFLGTGLMVFWQLLQRVSGQVVNIANMANSVQQSLTGARRVFEILDAPMDIQSKPSAIHIPRALGRVAFENVSFAYKDEHVLRNITFTIEPGQCVAILGATGAGKTTLLSMIPRFYDPTQGRVTLDGKDLRDLDLDDLRRNIGLVAQESFLFSNTVAANIAFGNPRATRAQVEHAARLACAHEFINELSQGYDTVLGERGADLSGGQRQRLSIARALILEPPLLILDDALSAVDPQTEHEMLQAIDNAARNRTTFIVAHRLSTLRRADLVLVLDKGRLVQVGTHEQLMSTSGHYRDAAGLQIADAESKMLLNMNAHAGSAQNVAAVPGANPPLNTSPDARASTTEPRP
jgi:ATP-binding cassette, subfamily B, bacterial